MRTLSVEETIEGVVTRRRSRKHLGGSGFARAAAVELDVPVPGFVQEPTSQLDVIVDVGRASGRPLLMIAFGLAKLVSVLDDRKRHLLPDHLDVECHVVKLIRNIDVTEDPRFANADHLIILEPERWLEPSRFAARPRTLVLNPTCG
jgi:hypothetical protein